MSDPLRESSGEGQAAGCADRRFDRTARLVGDAGMAALMRAHAMVVGVGGVGSWAAEALVRSGVGTVTLVDFDDVCITNFNRQVHAIDGLIGQSKAEVMAARMRSINPHAEIRTMPAFYNAEASEAILATRPDIVIDAIDCVSSKCHLLAACRHQGIRAICSTGSGGRLDPTQIAVADLSETDVDPLARMVRKLLRRHHGFPREGKGSFGIPAVFSREPPSMPRELACDRGSTRRCFCAKGASRHFNCDERNLILGSAVFVTGAFGLHVAALAVKMLLPELPPVGTADAGPDADPA